MGLEIEILDFIAKHLRSGWLDTLMVFITSLGDKGFIWIIIGVGLLFKRKTRMYGVMCLIALLFSLILCNGLIKNLLERERPFNIVEEISLLIHTPDDFSFPSGHTSAAFAVATVIWKMNRNYGIAAIVLAGLIGFSRLYLYVHFPTDVLGGMIVGISCGFFSVFIVKKAMELYERRV